MENTKVKLLLVEDDLNLGTLLREYLNAKNFSTDLYANGEDGYKAFKKNRYDICILDVMLPKKDGFNLAKDIRTINSDIPIIFLTAKSLKEDVYEGFKLGADDYITKPFNMQEVLMRIEAILRRYTIPASKQPQSFTLGKFFFDPNKQEMTSGEEIIHLTTKESDLLRLLCLNANIVLERDIALKSIWNDDNYFNARSMDVYITKLRKILKDTPLQILNVHGKGYKLII